MNASGQGFFGVGGSNDAISGSIISKMAADGHLGMKALSRNPCVGWAFLFNRLAFVKTLKMPKVPFGTATADFLQEEDDHPVAQILSKHCRNGTFYSPVFDWSISPVFRGTPMQSSPVRLVPKSKVFQKLFVNWNLHTRHASCRPTNSRKAQYFVLHILYTRMIINQLNCTDIEKSYNHYRTNFTLYTCIKLKYHALNTLYFSNIKQNSSLHTGSQRKMPYIPTVLSVYMYK